MKYTNPILSIMNRITSRIRRFIALISLLFLSVSGFSQEENQIFIGTNGKICSLEHALYIQKIKTKSPKLITVQTLHLKDSKWENFYTDQYRLINDSTYQIKTDNEDFNETIYRTFKKLDELTYQFKDFTRKNVIRTGTAESVVPLLLNGTVTEYYKNGNKKSVSDYSRNELLSNENWNEDGSKYLDNLYYSVDSDPTFVPGMQVMHQHILKGFRDAGIDLQAISGTILIGFVVLENGKIDGVKITQGIAPHLNSVAFEQFMTLKGEWKPARLNNQTVRSYQVFPINFIYKQYNFEFAELRGAILHFGAF